MLQINTDKSSYCVQGLVFDMAQTRAVRQLPKRRFKGSGQNSDFARYWHWNQRSAVPHALSSEFKEHREQQFLQPLKNFPEHLYLQQRSRDDSQIKV